MAWLIGLMSGSEEEELKRRGWEVENAAEIGFPDRNHRAVFVDNDMFDIMDGVGWEEGARHLRARRLVDELKALMRGKAGQDG